MFIDNMLDDVNFVPVLGSHASLRSLMHANNTVITADTAKTLAKSLFFVARWMLSNGMEINVNKCDACCQKLQNEYLGT
ncbi:hypothetical protein PAEPH01_2353 [Pancytospora epiphaga]|nr:hypothetical protein PAEPH01_2353 [Pancytospora epiphaga]